LEDFIDDSSTKHHKRQFASQNIIEVYSGWSESITHPFESISLLKNEYAKHCSIEQETFS